MTDEEFEAQFADGVPEFIIERERRFRCKPQTTYLEEYVDLAGVTRKRVRLTKKGIFDDRQKLRFLSIYSKTNRMMDSAEAVGVSPKTIREHIKTDEEFGQAVMEAEQAYRDHVVALIQDLAFNGTEKVNYDRSGNVISTEKIYPIRLIEMEAKRVEPGYRDKQDLHIGITGGVLVAPSSLGSIEEWEKKFGQQKVIDAEFQSVDLLNPPCEKEKMEESISHFQSVTDNHIKKMEE
jgi:hypothetical protein